MAVTGCSSMPMMSGSCKAFEKLGIGDQHEVAAGYLRRISYRTGLVSQEPLR